ncbi:MAG TPA: polysaccharide deacetylase family protein [Luteimonas sp.]|nr:polysaccharide deacetylase family protein [Luteimonas sp.]HRO26163.1 polysaccharide deacetylase family protein [Luteimonas sp.]HRP73220.1 polysaccharide deacetylase family protein [Luteimonas sp.]
MPHRSRTTRLLGLLPRRFVTTRIGTAERTLYLSFDDGPDPGFTPPILDLLKAHGATASFFLIGDRIDQHPAVVERIVAEGHTLGNHSWDHPFMSDLPLAGQLDQIARTDAALARYDGHATHPFRPPCGVLPARLLAHFARIGRGIAFWSYDSHDYERLPADILFERMQADPPGVGDVVLMHDDSADSVDLLARLLPQWREQGYTVRAMPRERG